MKIFFIDFLKGVIIGIANIIPGFSGGIMAVAFNVYDRIIDALNNILEHPIKTIKSIFALGVGAVVGIIICIVGINSLLELFPIPTILFFTGLMIGSIPSIHEKTKSENHKLPRLISFISGITLIIVLVILSEIFPAEAEVAVINNDSFSIYGTLFFLGLLLAPTIIIPGVSGSLIMIIFGYYTFLINTTTSFIKSAFSFDFQGMLSNAGYVISLVIGTVIGILLLSKLIKKLLDTYPKIIYSIILGILVATPFAIIYQIDYAQIDTNNLALNWIIGIIFLILGTLLSNWAIEFEKKHTDLNEKKH